MSNVFNFHGNVNMNVYCKKCAITEEPDNSRGLEINSVTVDFEIGFIFELTNTSGTHVGAVITINDGDVELDCQETTSEYIIPLEAAQVLFGGQTLTFTSYSDNCQTSTCEVIIPISFNQLEIPVTGENTTFELNGEPVCTEDSSYSIVLAGPNSIVMNNTNGNLTIPAQEIDSNGAGGVYIYYYLCGGEVVYFVIVFMANPQGPRQMYSCNGNMCIEDSEGQYDHSSCYGNCNGGPTMYSCDNGNCVEDEEGIYDEPTCFEGECYVAPVGLRMLFDDIANAPVVDPTNVGQWNTFYDLPTNGAVFTSVVVAGNQVTLIGGGVMTISNSLFAANSNLIEIEDQSSIVIEIEDYAFQSAFAITLVGLQDLVTAGEEGFNGCSLVTTFDFPLLTTLGENFFTNCTSATLINLPLCVNLANNPASITAFQFITGQVITLNIAAVNATNNAGGVHASVAYLIANNTATVNYI